MTPTKIKPIPGPRKQLCWKPGERMTDGRCDRMKGHGGDCTPTLLQRIRALERGTDR